MRFGIEFGSYPADLAPVEVCQQVTQRAQVAYKNNFEALFVAQHFLTGPDAAILQSIPLLAYLAGQVPGMYLGTSIFLLPLHHPVMVAEYISTLDNLCGGKVLFGVGQGPDQLVLAVVQADADRAEVGPGEAGQFLDEGLEGWRLDRQPGVFVRLTICDAAG